MARETLPRDMPRWYTVAEIKALLDGMAPDEPVMVYGSEVIPAKKELYEPVAKARKPKKAREAFGYIIPQMNEPCGKKPKAKKK